MDLLRTGSTLVLAALLPAALAARPLPAAANEDVIGVAALAMHQVRGTLEKHVHAIRVSTPVRRDEVIETGADSLTQLVLLDESIVTLGPDSHLILDEMVYKPGAGGNLSVFISRGIASFVSGILPSTGYSIRTPTATIGIRGTAFDVIVAADGATSVILRSGLLRVSNLAGEAQSLTAAGTFTRVAAPAVAPTPPAVAPPSLRDAVGVFRNIRSGGDPGRGRDDREAGSGRGKADPGKEARSRTDGRPGRAAEKAAEGASGAAERASKGAEKAGEAASKASETAAGAAEKATEAAAKASEAAAKASETAAGAAEKASEAAAKATEAASKAAEAASNAAEKASEAASKAAEVASRAAEKAAEASEKAAEKGGKKDKD